MTLAFPKPGKKDKAARRPIKRTASLRKSFPQRSEKEPAGTRHALPGPQRTTAPPRATTQEGTGRSSPGREGAGAAAPARVLRELPKAKRYVDREYLAWVRKQPCLLHGERCQQQPERDAHHLVSKGAGGSDRCAVPLCRNAHALVHAMGLGFLRGKGIDPWREAWRLVERYEGRS